MSSCNSCTPVAAGAPAAITVSAPLVLLLFPPDTLLWLRESSSDLRLATFC
jgi:hypothetical protein